MFKTYYVNKVINNGFYHEIHTEDCPYLPSISNRVYSGRFSNCDDALKEAKNKLSTTYVDGCYWCSKKCHRE